MAKGKRKKANNIGHKNYHFNKERRVKSEAHRCEKKLVKLLRRGLNPDSERCARLKAHIKSLSALGTRKSKLKG